ncbi:MAG TPA: energy transducer TonB [Candidatus Cybelea sp.]|jgi:TonB family protein|nr:energy transducer TonB [Candidatus Cybelea sp.]
MSVRTDCEAVERLAGAIAIGEADDRDRESYRSHLAVCRHCLTEFGGERAIERVMATVANARDDESWQPDLRPALARPGSRRYGWSAAIALAAAIAVVVGVRSIDRPQPPVTAQRSISMHEARAIAVLNTQTVPPREGRAESLSLGPETLAATVRVSVSARGTPARCTIVKSSGNAILDRSMCATAMRERYSLEAPAH